MTYTHEDLRNGADRCDTNGYKRTAAMLRAGSDAMEREKRLRPSITPATQSLLCLRMGRRSNESARYAGFISTRTFVVIGQIARTGDD